MPSHYHPHTRHITLSKLELEIISLSLLVLLLLLWACRQYDFIGVIDKIAVTICCRKKPQPRIPIIRSDPTLHDLLFDAEDPQHVMDGGGLVWNDDSSSDVSFFSDLFVRTSERRNRALSEHLL
eukprot:CAMPEP_0118673706 /NCGR_PEP_ID=MMETSP0800-20121206/482_1 /TAXON_ID=210618 ORGANISM="Striatella unipunctata, Strain CCMP2910" /NCGR_SAMPLE_ID=MMETSP0800 /ASSEMBLY_ACC=CAM_ASM_000638 /LENGTH=123 /DNA_ID=CAMNT_0006568821 /DNA_START=1 /DNA_END=372 /DNA_ORIENTATION=-